MMSCAQPMCPKLPSFLLKLASETELVKPVISYEPTLRSEAPSYSTLNKHNSGYSKIESAKTRAEIVVPAALVGSRKDTTLMRLSNRVRLLERNVSVSMRYLEELSQSYRRQMDRLSRSFNLTTSWLKATAQGAEERDHMQQVSCATRFAYDDQASTQSRITKSLIVLLSVFSRCRTPS
ncbi:hypothetical protein P879_11421 [Paragonimus westermani]|uniref:Uncharacterized protein n=1 Tax=Paragonimus westermani TaxID=34504 RepID=A0A8T0DD67_9TREM|nr:hypothetical protein P879_11421 [Paragonimus westermani]